MHENMQKETNSESKKDYVSIPGDEFKGDALSNAIASFFHLFVTVLLVECEKSCRPHLT